MIRSLQVRIQHRDLKNGTRDIEEDEEDDEGFIDTQQMSNQHGGEMNGGGASVSVSFSRKRVKKENRGSCLRSRQAQGEESIIVGGATPHLHTCVTC